MFLPSSHGKHKCILSFVINKKHMRKKFINNDYDLGLEYQYGFQQPFTHSKGLV